MTTPCVIACSTSTHIETIRNTFKIHFIKSIHLKWLTSKLKSAGKTLAKLIQMNPSDRVDVFHKLTTGRGYDTLVEDDKDLSSVNKTMRLLTIKLNITNKNEYSDTLITQKKSPIPSVENLTKDIIAGRFNNK